MTRGLSASRHFERLYTAATVPIAVIAFDFDPLVHLGVEPHRPLADAGARARRVRVPRCDRDPRAPGPPSCRRPRLHRHRRSSRARSSAVASATRCSCRRRSPLAPTSLLDPAVGGLELGLAVVGGIATGLDRRAPARVARRSVGARRDDPAVDGDRGRQAHDGPRGERSGPLLRGSLGDRLPRPRTVGLAGAGRPVPPGAGLRGCRYGDRGGPRAWPRVRSARSVPADGTRLLIGIAAWVRRARGGHDVLARSGRRGPATQPVAVLALVIAAAAIAGGTRPRRLGCHGGAGVSSGRLGRPAPASGPIPRPVHRSDVSWSASIARRRGPSHDPGRRTRSFDTFRAPSRISHWIGGRLVAGTSGRQRRRLRPGHGARPQARRLRLGRGGRCGGRGGAGSVPGLALDVAEQAHRHPVPDPEPGRRAPPRARGAPDRRARQGPVRRARRDRPRPREPRVRLRHPEPAQGRLQRAGEHRHRRLPDPPAAGGRRGHHALQLPGDGADVDVRDGDRLRQHVHPQAIGEGPVGVDLHRRAARRRPACPTASSTSSTATRWRSTRSSSTPTSPPSASSARRRSRATSTRPARSNGKRVQALGGAKNHMVVLPDADIDMAADAAVSAGYGSAGERCMAIATVVAVGDVADPLVEAITKRLPKVKVGPGLRSRRPRWGRSSRASTATRSRLSRLRRRRRARRSSPTGGSTRSTAIARASSWACR